MSITATLDDGRAASELAKLQATLADPTPLHRLIAAGLERNFNKRFNARVDPDGKAWMPWADSTHALRTKQGKSNLLEFSNPGMRDSVRKRAGRQGASLVMLSPIAGYHEQLTAPKKGKLPRRAMLFSKDGGLGDMDKQMVEKASADYFKRMLG